MFKVLWPVSRYSLGKELQSLGLSTENARSRHEFRQYDGMTSWWPAAERRWRLCAISETGRTQSAARYRGTVPMRQRQVKMMTIYLTRWGTSSQWRLSYISCVKPPSNFLIPVADFPHKTRFVSKNTGQEPVAKIITQKTGQEPIAETIGENTGQERTRTVAETITW